jgi:hypothetical protein
MLATTCHSLPVHFLLSVSPKVLAKKATSRERRGRINRDKKLREGR